MKEKALRDTQIRSIHEIGELKRAQELRVDEFSVQTLRESHHKIHKLNSHIQELQERANCMTDFGEFQEIETNYIGFFHVPVNQQSFQVHDLCYAATNACHLIHGICLGHRETFLAIHVTCSIYHSCFIKNSSLNESNCHRCYPSTGEYRETCGER